MTRLLSFSLVLVLGYASIASAQTTTTPEEPIVWKAGAAKATITPRDHLWMAGYAARKKPADGIAQDLFAKALALEDHAGQRAVIVTLDFIGVGRSLRDAVVARCLSDYQLAADAILFNASHTHCGPSLSIQDGVEEQLKQYRAELENTLVKIIGQAVERLAPARISYSQGRCGFAMNRRRPSEKGYQNRPTFAGPVDHEVPVLAVQNAENKVIALAFGYACHATTVFSTTLAPAAPTFMFHGDYPGFAQQALEQAYPDAVALFVNGCSGDQNPYPRNGEFPGKQPLEMAEQHGKSLATAVVAGMQGGSRPIAGSIRAVTGEVTLERNEGKPDHNYLVQAMRLGDALTLVALGSETVVDYSLRLKHEIKSPAVWIAGYSNEMVGYVPSRRVAAEGGYEAGMNFKLDIEERIIKKVHDLVRSLNETGK